MENVKINTLEPIPVTVNNRKSLWHFVLGVMSKFGESLQSSAASLFMSRPLLGGHRVRLLQRRPGASLVSGQRRSGRRISARRTVADHLEPTDDNRSGSGQHPAATHAVKNRRSTCVGAYANVIRFPCVTPTTLSI